MITDEFVVRRCLRGTRGLRALGRLPRCDYLHIIRGALRLVVDGAVLLWSAHSLER